jgi:hypothetical protein
LEIGNAAGQPVPVLPVPGRGPKYPVTHGVPLAAVVWLRQDGVAAIVMSLSTASRSQTDHAALSVEPMIEAQLPCMVMALRD